ncbi:MAG: tRNA threonylcarbamoyladenosine dehydratase [Ruminococcaceae bacterium]|nr:tRNA threonylcarbamoyladenosine dehydratase [Oscillospiraceae bacterium]
MEEKNSRTAMLIGEDAVNALKKARVAVFGVGGVGGYAVEALVRAGVGAVDLIDADRVSISNINRQIIATEKTVGMLKTDAAEERILSINPLCRVKKYPIFFDDSSAKEFNFSDYSYVIDAIDFVKGKLALAELCQSAKVPLIAAMGAGNKLDPTAFEVADIYETSVCPLARVMRTELKKRGIKHLKVVYSREKARRPIVTEAPEDGRIPPASISFVPSVAGLIIAGEVIKDLTREYVPKSEN